MATALLLLLTWWMERTRDVGGGRDGHTQEVSGDEVEGEGVDNGSR